jgi:uncharacterized protein YbjQ (UPF0145 family)
VNDKPETGVRRAAWSSALSINDFAACIEAGVEPIGFVQGCSVVSWTLYRSDGVPEAARFVEQFNCPHNSVSGNHRQFGKNSEEIATEALWMAAFSGALTRLLDEAGHVGAHGVIGVVESTTHLSEDNAFEFKLSGTAVCVAGVARPRTPFSTFLAGQKLNKLVQAGFAPVSIVWSFASIGVYPSCVTSSQLHFVLGTSTTTPTGEIDQVSRAHQTARSLAREDARRQVDGGLLHGAHLVAVSREMGDGLRIDVTLRGNYVRRFRDFEPLLAPRPVVRLDR